MDLPEQVRRSAERHGMFQPGQTVVVAVSGGPDSMALLHALHHLCNVWSISLVAAHLDHGFRGGESAADAEYVRAFCARIQIPVHIAFEDVPALKKRLHLSSQEAARRARHEFLRSVALEVGAERIALGHTRDDRVETILLNILRGCGPDGLEGFPPVRFPVVRPLYDTARSDTHAYCAANGLQPRMDASNESRNYRRNRLRLDLLPTLAEHFNPRIDEALLRLSNLVTDEKALLDELADTALSRSALDQGSDKIVLDAAKLNAEPIALRRRVLRLAIQQVRGDITNLNASAVERLLDAALWGEHAAFDLPQGESEPCRISAGTGFLSIERIKPAVAEAPDWEVPLPDEGRVDLPTGEAIEIRRFDTVDEARSAYRQAIAASGRVSDGRDALLLRLSGVRLPLSARSWRKGDRMRPRGLNGSKKLQDIFVDRKIPVGRRWAFAVIAETPIDSRRNDTAVDDLAVGAGGILGILGVQGSESSLSLAEGGRAMENMGACVLIMALSDRGIT